VRRGMRLGPAGLAAALRTLRPRARLIDGALGRFAVSPITLPPLFPEDEGPPTDGGLKRHDAVTAAAAAAASRAWHTSSPLSSAVQRIADRVSESMRGSFPTFAAYSLGLWDVQPVQRVVAFVSRKNKRFILNEPEVLQGLEKRLEQDANERAAAAAEAVRRRCVADRNSSSVARNASGSGSSSDWRMSVGGDSRLTPPPLIELATLEDMPLFEQVHILVLELLRLIQFGSSFFASYPCHGTCPLQIRLFRRTTFLIGVHGSALINSPFMAKGATLLVSLFRRCNNSGRRCVLLCDAGGAVVQLVPYKLGNAGSFFAGPAQVRALHCQCNSDFLAPVIASPLARPGLVKYFSCSLLVWHILSGKIHGFRPRFITGTSQMLRT
jgi:hypothetical protein